ncbi:hypothetical protein POTOM_045120 [Populus tomentosa]|uniref:Uncharacterized protein n=1 Tax=Populus tomentosa TaxID=118781 RepID=A0A8X7YIC6_POPTO|nr:hypothetical protein POTOM_045120 [Populus tomentosa]
MKISTLLSIEDPDNYLKAGVFTSAIYDEDCIFEDPTIKFQGTKLYSRNLKFLVPFFNCPSIGLQAIEKVIRANPDVLTVRTISAQRILQEFSVENSVVDSLSFCSMISVDS